MRSAYAKYLFSVLMFGSNGIIASYIALSSYEIVLLRTLLGTLFLVLVFVLARQKLTAFQHGKELTFIMGSGVFMGTSWMCLYEGFQLIGVSISTLLYFTGPVIVMMLSPLLFGERLTPVKLVSLVFVLVGLVLVNGLALQDGMSARGLLIGFLSAVLYAGMVVLNKKAVHITGLQNSMLQLASAFITVAVFVGFKSGFMIDIAPEDCLPIIILGLLNTGFGCYLYFSSIGKLPVQTVAVCGYLEPLSAVVLSAVVLGERLLVPQLVGALLIIGGAAASELFGRSKAFGKMES